MQPRRFRYKRPARPLSFRPTSRLRRVWDGLSHVATAWRIGRFLEEAGAYLPAIAEKVAEWLSTLGG